MAAGAVVSISMGVMKPVLYKLAALMGDEYKKIKGLRKEVAFLQRELGDMDALLEKMDCADELDPQAKKWRRDIIEMSYNIEDRIDDFMHSVGEANKRMGVLRKASHYVKTFKDRRRLANEFQEIKTLVTEASDRRKRYMLDQCISVTTPVVVDPRMSALYQESTSLVGIESQKDELISWAMDEAKQLKFMAIVGFGGIGKTTLANELYREVGGKFVCKAFISVSQKPQMIGLFNSLLRQLGQETYSHACQLQDPINDLRGHLQDKRYFIVVDDLWDVPAWDAIKHAFPQSNHSSRVIITTRNENVASSCCHNHGYIHNMKHLSEQDSRKLFFGRIFGSENACPNGLKKASSEILRKCGGLPLAIITISSMLACQPRMLEGQWEYIQNSLDIKSATNSKYEDMIYILDLSYKNLPHHLKACFLYLGSYPEDYQIERVELVRRWVTEGFVSNSRGQEVWDVAESYFNELVNRSMIQPTYDFYTAKVSGCKVHDMLLDLIVQRCKEDNFLHLVNAPGAVAEVQHDVIRRLTVVGLRGIQEEIKVAKTVGQNLSQIRSLTILVKSNWTPWLLELKLLRVLSLNNYSYGIKIDITCINRLSQLRYLSVKGNFMPPRQIRGQRLLETLILNCWCTATSNIALEIDNVPRLCHFSVPYHIHTRLCDGNIGKLKLLRSLYGFILPINSLESIIGMGQLTALSELGILFPKGCTALEKVACMEALSTSLEKLGNLRVLNMSYSFDKVTWRVDVLSSLSPTFHDLEQLRMRGCTFSRVPRWLGHLQNLRRLGLSVKQMVEEDFSLIGTGAPSLLSLNLRISGILTERIVIRGSMGFASVKYFEFNCDCISYLSFETGSMPKLQQLELVFDANEWDKAAPGGLQHLPRLNRIGVKRSRYDTAEWRGRHDNDMEASKVEEELIRGVFQKAADALPTCPTFIFVTRRLLRPVEEE